LIQRGLDPDEIIDTYRVKAGGIIGEWKYRLMIPVFQKGVLTTYQGRDITNTSDLRYKTLSIEKSVENPKHCLYNMDNATDDVVVVCEGVVDVWKIGSGAVATLGTSTTEEQVRKLAQYKKVFILFDPEDTAQRRAKKLGEKISALGSQVEVIHTGLGHDPGDMTGAEVMELRHALSI
jgi:DNA primase